MTQEQYKYYSNGYDDGKQSVGDQYVQILLKKDQEIERLKAENSKMRNALEEIREIRMIDYSVYMKVQDIIRKTIK